MPTTVFRHAHLVDGFRHRGRVGDVLVVLDRDPFAAPDEIGAATVRSTWVDGACVQEV